MTLKPAMTTEESRLEESRSRNAHLKRWGPYLSERQWGTVREDYSPGGTAWDFFPHDHARSRTYRWGEDGIAGISDRHQLICFALAMWNGRDPILKERLFGLTGNEGNHGEDVKEYYFYLDSTPTHSYMKTLYKYPQAEFPYAKLVHENSARGRSDFEYELMDTGVFEENRYFDIFTEYAKESADDILIKVTAINRGSLSSADGLVSQHLVLGQRPVPSLPSRVPPALDSAGVWHHRFRRDRTRPQNLREALASLRGRTPASFYRK